MYTGSCNITLYIYNIISILLYRNPLFLYFMLFFLQNRGSGGRQRLERIVDLSQFSCRHNSILNIISVINKTVIIITIIIINKGQPFIPVKANLCSIAARTWGYEDHCCSISVVGEVALSSHRMQRSMSQRRFPSGAACPKMLCGAAWPVVVCGSINRKYYKNYCMSH